MKHCRIIHKPHIYSKSTNCCCILGKPCGVAFCPFPKRYINEILDKIWKAIGQAFNSRFEGNQVWQIGSAPASSFISIILILFVKGRTTGHLMLIGRLAPLSAGKLRGLVGAMFKSISDIPIYLVEQSITARYSRHLFETLFICSWPSIFTRETCVGQIALKSR